MAVPPPSKSDLRRDLKDRRQCFVSAMEREARSDAAASAAWHVWDTILAAQCVAAYLPIACEIDTAPVIEMMATAGITIALPHITDRPDSLRFLRWARGDITERGPFGLRQPSAGAAQEQPDVILTPLLGFDRCMRRIGYGVGYYDRAFAVHPRALRIGLAWSVQECKDIPVDDWDIPLHAVATEREWIAQ